MNPRPASPNRPALGRPATALLAVAIALAAATLTGCVTPPGVDVINNTGRTINVEYMVVAADGSLQTYSKGVVSRNANVTFKVDQTDSNGARIRFALPDVPQEDGNFVQLNVPEGQTKYYDLEYAGGRLVARERKKGQIKWYRSE